MTRPVTLVMLAAVVLGAQEKPDFSGRWVLVTGESSGSDIPKVLSVRQTLVRTTARGEAITPFFKDIAVTREFESGTHSETHAIGVIGGFVPGRRVDGSRNGPQGHRAVKWDGNALVFESGTHTGESPEAAVWTERREVWSLEADGRLRVTISRRNPVDGPRSVTLFYRRS